jgi:uncharacterized protein (DUF885 family)
MPYSDLAVLAADFWTWRALTQPSSGDDIPRIERPTDWLPDWSPDAVADRHARFADFDARWRSLAEDALGWAIPHQVDYRLVGSALARVHWELEVLQGWRRNPHFYIHQSLGPIFEALLLPQPNPRQLLNFARNVPATVDAATANLAEHAVRPFAELALNALHDVRAKLQRVHAALPGSTDQLEDAFGRAADALETFGDWLEPRLEQMPDRTPIGRQAYAGFLHQVALVPMTPEQVAAAGQQELERSISFETFEQLRNRDLPPLPIPMTQQEQISNHLAAEQQVRDFCEQHDLLSFPRTLGHYRNAPQPAYLAPLRGLGVTDDLTSPTRLDQDGVHYIPEPSPELPYFYLAMARDPRTLIAHEGVHYYQLARSWAHDNPIRRHYYDSGPNEGIGFYAEEMLLQAGLFDDRPRSREIIYNFMRLRALRVAVDVKLALGVLTIDAAADELARLVPMDTGTAHEEASFFASDPGQAITYQIGKLQILRFLSDARLARGNAFDVRQFHDALWVDGNVPISLQRWEALGLADEIAALDSNS